MTYNHKNGPIYSALTNKYTYAVALYNDGNKRILSSCSSSAPSLPSGNGWVSCVSPTAQDYYVDQYGNESSTPPESGPYDCYRIWIYAAAAPCPYSELPDCTMWGSQYGQTETFYCAESPCNVC